MINGETMAKTQQVQYKYTGGIVDAVRGSLPNYLKQYAKGIANKVLYETTGKKLDDTTEEDLTKAEVDVIKGAITKATMSGEMEFHNLGTSRDEWKTLGSGVNPIRDAEATIGGATVTVDPGTGRVGIKDPYDYSDYPNLSLLQKAMGDAFKDNRLFGAGLGLGPHLVGEGKEGELYFDMQRANAGLNPHMSRDVPYPGAFNTKISMNPVEFVRYAEKLGHKSTPILDTLQRTGMDKNLMESKENFGGGLPGILWQDEAFGTDSAPSQTEDPGYYDEDIDLRRGGQISQGLDNLYMNKRDSKQKLNNMMGFQERQYGGGLDDTYLNMSRRRSNAFADPNANTAFDSPMSIGGLPTVYRQDGGDMDFMSTYTQEDIDEAMAPDPPEAEFGAGQYVPPQRGDPMIPLNAPPKGSYVNPPDTPFRSFSPNRLTYEAQQKVNRETQGRTPAEMDYRVGMPQLAYPSQAIIDDDILNMRLAAQNKIDEEKREQANKPDQTSAVSLYLHNIANLGKTFGATAIPPSALYKAVETPTGAASLLSAIGKGDFGNRALNLAPPQELIDKANQLNRKSGGGLPTVYRQDGGPTWGDYPDDAADAAFDAAMAGPTDDGLGAVLGGGGPPGGAPIAPPAPPAPTTGGAGPDIPDWAWSVDDKGISSIVGPEGQVDPNYEHAGSGIEGRQELLARWRGKKEADGMNRMEYTYLNDIRDKTGMTMPKAEEYLASVMATPGGVAAMEEGFNLGYTGGGPFGTIGNFIGGIGDDLGMAGIYERERKRQQADKDFKAGFTGEDPSILTNIQDTVSRYFKGREGITTIEGQEEFKAALERQGHTFTPKTQSDIDKYIGYGLSMVNPLSSVASIAEFITGATPLGTITSKEGLSFTLDANGKVIPEQFFDQDIDYGPDPIPKKPVPKKKKKKILPEEKKKTTDKKTTSSLPSIKESNIERLKTYMSLTGKDLSDSKQDLAITDISITEEDFT